MRLEAAEVEIAEHAIPNKRDADSRVSESILPSKIFSHDTRSVNREAINCQNQRETN